MTFAVHTAPRFSIRKGCLPIPMEGQVLGDSLVFAIDKEWHGRPLMSWLSESLRLPSNFLMHQFNQQAFLVGNTPVMDDYVMEFGQRIRLLGGIQEPYGVVVPDELFTSPLEVLYEDDHALIVNKPAGLLVYPGTGEDSDTLAHRVAAYYAWQGVMHKVRHAHRLDRDTTGAVLYAKHAYSARTFDAMLAEHQIHRSYIALVLGRPYPKSGLIDVGIGRDRHVSGRYRASASGKPARTRYRTIHSVGAGHGAVSLVECVLETGRTHQIRVHLAHAGWPVIGDPLYGGGHGVGDLRWGPGYALHAAQLSMIEPYVEQSIQVQAPLPKLFETHLSKLGLMDAWNAEQRLGNET